jgi:hypothetical protein
LLLQRSKFKLDQGQGVNQLNYKKNMPCRRPFNGLLHEIFISGFSTKQNPPSPPDLKPYGTDGHTFKSIGISSLNLLLPLKGQAIKTLLSRKDCYRRLVLSLLSIVLCLKKKVLSPQRATPESWIGFEF